MLDTVMGTPAAGLHVTLRRLQAGGDWTELDRRATDGDGRVASFAGALEGGEYQLEFAAGAYFRGAGRDCFYPAVLVNFVINDGEAHHHVPLLLAPFGYTTYRGS